ncbi:hypothetical protein I79_009003 [Cricetulus griseus]|uniref:Uncharacterized protein n=1 Tax=Cricetulus griseus TaxID=10029 RepID=G3HEL6_CRIGR|nr:hypothetical protein I79_009003 [Cricetulus griseus]
MRLTYLNRYFGLTRFPFPVQVGLVSPLKTLSEQKSQGRENSGLAAQAGSHLRWHSHLDSHLHQDICFSWLPILNLRLVN